MSWVSQWPPAPPCLVCIGQCQSIEWSPYSSYQGGAGGGRGGFGRGRGDLGCGGCGGGCSLGAGRGGGGGGFGGGDRLRIRHGREVSLPATCLFARRWTRLAASMDLIALLTSGVGVPFFSKRDSIRSWSGSGFVAICSAASTPSMPITLRHGGSTTPSGT